MGSAEKIKDHDVFDTIVKLIEDKTPIRIRLQHKEIEHLTVITGLRLADKTKYFQIHIPEHMQALPAEGGAEQEGLELQVEFSGRDNLTHRFYTEKAMIIDKVIWAAFPEYIHRIQKRDNFRVQAPLGSKIHFTAHSEHHHLNIDNISLGGAFAYCRGRLDSADLFFRLQVGHKLTQASLVIPSMDDVMRIDIQDCHITRIETDPIKRKYGLGLQFATIPNGQKSTLTKVIYAVQREFLKSRLKRE